MSGASVAVLREATRALRHRSCSTSEARRTALLELDKVCNEIIVEAEEPIDILPAIKM